MFTGVYTSCLLYTSLDGKCLREKCEQNHDLGYELLKRFSQIIDSRLEATRFQLLDVYGCLLYTSRCV